MTIIMIMVTMIIMIIQLKRVFCKGRNCKRILRLFIRSLLCLQVTIIIVIMIILMIIIICTIINTFVVITVIIIIIIILCTPAYPVGQQ